MNEARSISAETLEQRRDAVVRRLQRALVEKEELSRSTLGADTRLSGSALSEVIRDLETREVLKGGNASSSADAAPNGRRSRYALKAKGGAVLAFGIGHEKLAVAVTDLRGQLFDDRADVANPVDQFPTADSDPTSALSRAAEMATTALRKTGISKDRIVGIGVSLPAPLDGQRRPYSGFMDAWQSRNVGQELLLALGLERSCPVELGNDANLAAMREHQRGAARGATDACVIKWGAGLGAGFILNGALYQGHRGLAGEIGHIETAGIEAAGDLREALTKEERECPRCHQECVEALISSTALVRYLGHNGFPFGRIQDVIEAALNKNDPAHDAARDAFRKSAKLLGHKMGPIVSALNLERIVVDCFADQRAFELIIDGLQTGLEGRMVPAAAHQLTLQAAICAPTAAILGAADRVLEAHLGAWISRQPKPEESRSAPSIDADS